jgi:hypothetical protein
VKADKFARVEALLGYARVDDQENALQTEALKAPGCQAPF